MMKHLGLIVAVAALVSVVWMPTPQGLPLAGQLMLGILAVAVISWMSEALDYGVSAVVITAAATALLVVFALTYWPRMGYMGQAG